MLRGTKIALTKNMWLQRQFSLNCSEVVFIDSSIIQYIPKKRLMAFLRSALLK